MAMRIAYCSVTRPAEWSMVTLSFCSSPVTCNPEALTGSTIVATTMSNMGLEIALRKAGIGMLRANVGDKYVLEEMLKTGAILGGEQSGHIIFRDGEATTGDGLLTALRVMEIVARSGKSLADLDRRPQSLSADDSERSCARKDTV